MSDKIKSGASMEFQVILRLTEIEARALEGLTGYSMDDFIKVFYEKLGKHYLGPHEKGLRSLFKTIREEIPSHLSRFDEARKIFNGEKISIHKQS